MKLTGKKKKQYVELNYYFNCKAYESSCGKILINFQRNYFSLCSSSQYERSLFVCGSNVVCRHFT